LDLPIRLRDKTGKIVEMMREPPLKDAIMDLYREGYPNSFDEYDLAQIAADLRDGSPCLVAREEGGHDLLGALQFVKWPAIQAGWLLSYLFVRNKNRGIGKMLCAALEELLKKEARIIFTTHAGILPDYSSSYGFFIKAGYREWGVLPGYFRDDLWGVFFAKRNPYYPIGKGIPRHSGWCKALIDERTGKHISRKEYRAIKCGLEPVAKNQWGLSRSSLVS